MSASWSTIPRLVDDAAERFGDLEAFVDGDRRWTFAEYRDRIHAAARALMARGIGPGDRIAVWAPNLAEWAVAAIGAHDYFIYGLRPRVDIMKVKTSITHVINTNEKFGATEMVCGRSKLHGNKRGTRPWNVYRVCFCRGGRHTPVPKNIRLDNQGNPTGPVTWNPGGPRGGG